ncbi:MAG: glutamate--tRNA ligase [Candidatus Doudnabacteria bacterium]|nr:glutamate--tRNA ligase [Candidatus Doudnabacteria bacterium]
MADKSLIRTRFAPSPTGFVHIGNFRTALFSHLWARHNGGTSILRIEDTDQNRKVEGAIEYLLRVMKQMGVEFDEGFYLKDDGTTGERGDFGPYLQSQRLALYQKFADQLISQKQAYYCFCSEERLNDLRKEQVALKKPPMYDRHCYNLSEEQKQKLMDEFKASGKNPVIRFFIPEGQTVVKDLIYGHITYENRVLDDQVIIKSDGFPTYHLAVVVDDHHMQITHVIRGEEWIPSTPKHILIYKALGWEPTLFAHLPLILNPDKSKLSKRQGDVATEDYLKKGYLPQVLVNFVAMLGWNPKTEQEIFSMDDLVKQFDLSKVNKSGAVFDLNKLDWISSQYIRLIPDKELADLLVPYWKQNGINTDKSKIEYLTSIAGLEKERLKKLSEIGERTGYFFAAPDYNPDLLVWKKSDKEKTRRALERLSELLKTEENFSQGNLEIVIKKFIAENNFDNGSVLWPLRVALTGQEKSPGPFEVCATLALGPGKEEILMRLNRAIQKLS